MVAENFKNQLPRTWWPPAVESSFAIEEAVDYCNLSCVCALSYGRTEALAEIVNQSCAQALHTVFCGRCASETLQVAAEACHMLEQVPG